MIQRYDSELRVKTLSHSLPCQQVEQTGRLPGQSGKSADEPTPPSGVAGWKNNPTALSMPTTSRPVCEERLTPHPDSDSSRDPVNRVSSPIAISFPPSAGESVLSPEVNTEADSNGGQTPPTVAETGQAAEERGFIPVLRNRNFLVLWGGQVFSQMADKVYLILVIALVASQFQAEDQTISGWVSAIMIAFTIPAVLFGSVAGVFVDRWSKKGVLVATNLLRGALVLAIPPMLWISQDWGTVAGLPIGFCILLGVTFLVSTLTQFFAPAEQSAMPLVVERGHLLSANSLYTMTMMASVIVGFAVGEPILGIADLIVQQLGGGADIGKELVVGGSYALAGILLMSLKTGEKNLTPEQEPPHVWEDLRDGLRYLKSHSRIRSALIQLVILFSVFAALSVLAVRLAEVLPGIKASQFGFLLAAGGVGMAGGASILGHLGQQFSHSRLSRYGSIGVALSLMGLGIFTQQLWIALLLTMLLGGFGALVAVPMQTTIQAETPDQMRGKVFGLQNNVINIALTLPLALAGVAETILGLQSVFLGLAAIVFAGGLLSWYISGTGSTMSTKADK